MESLAKLFGPKSTVFKLPITGPISTKTLVKVESCLHKRYRQPPKALALLINSPGGSACQSSLIASTVKAFGSQHGIPIFAFAEDIAASGGYYIMTAADHLYADPASLIGSIGARFSHIGIKSLANKWGIERRNWSTSKYALEERVDPLREFTEENKTWATQLVNATAKQFQDIVKQARKDKLKFQDEVFEDVFTAHKALELGLVDEIGRCDSVMKEKFPDAKIIDIGKESPWKRFGDLIS